MDLERNQQVDQPFDSFEPIGRLVERIAGMLVNEPEHVVVRKLDEPETIVLQLQVGPNDVGRVIGRNGATAKAIRTILSAAGRKLGRRVTLEILD